MTPPRIACGSARSCCNKPKSPRSSITILRFTQRFGDVQQLADAELDEVLHHWTGLGYYARARNLHKTAQAVVTQYNGEFPDTQAELEALPGIGRSTAGAIRAIAQHHHATILDGNVKRVLSRFHAVPGYPGKTDVAKTLWQLAEQHTPKTNTHLYTQAIMDLGATLCGRRRPDCANCPVASRCESHLHNTTHLFPNPKPKKTKPVRQARFFVLSDEAGTTLLQQKPLNGLWGGLWSPLDRSSTTKVAEVLEELGWRGDAVIDQRNAPSFRHTFTHFHLDIEPVYVTLRAQNLLLLDDSTFAWVQPTDLNEQNNAVTVDDKPIGLCAPAVKMLASLKPVFEQP